MNDDFDDAGPGRPIRNVGGFAKNMTLRDYFAAKAMAAIVAGPHIGGGDGYEAIAVYAYAMADAMLEERK